MKEKKTRNKKGKKRRERKKMGKKRRQRKKDTKVKKDDKDSSSSSANKESRGQAKPLAGLKIYSSRT